MDNVRGGYGSGKHSTLQTWSVSQTFCDCMEDTCCQIVECCRHAGEACGPDCSGVEWQDPEIDHDA